jgi:two-component system chemotaxis sensor kinase CheA
VSTLLRYVAASQESVHEVGALVDDMSRQYASDTTYMSMVIDELEEEIKRVRMLPLSTITGPLGRMVRDLARGTGKEAVLEIVGSDTELDKQVLEQIKDPLVHGIERPDRREARGKPRAGTLTLSAEQLGKNIVICISDDGAGLDYESIRESIVRRGVLDVGSLNDADLKEAIFQAGVSTSPIITDISGRGVGLDIVRKNVEALRGTVNVHSTPGDGTTFTLTLPLRLASSRGLLVHVGANTYAIPLNNVVKIDHIALQEISSLEGQDTIWYDGRPLTLVRLRDVLELPPAAGENGSVEEEGILVVIVVAAERRMAFAVDGLVGQQEMVIKGLGKQLSRVGGIAGATVLGNRQVVLVLNVGDLIKLAMKSKRRSVLDTLSSATSLKAQQAQKQVLVVDDSITTRTLEKNILEAAGYTVRLATDGREALGDIASRGVPNLIVTDVAMPRMNGFELTRQIREDEHTADLPVILVTSLDSDEDKARGIEVGADAYIIKSSFDQDNLLETIEQLI